MMDTEAVLLRRFARTGDAEAFAEIIRRHAGLVYGAAWRILADMDRASDVVQETFLQLTKDAAKVTGSLPGWLHRVATHKAIDVVRRDASRRQREERYATQLPHRVTAWKEISPCVDEGLNSLDTELREILVAHFLEGQTTRQIAHMRGISQATVSRRLESGVVKLRSRLRKRGLLVTVGALSMLLGDNAINAAPAVLKAELGKMALTGGHAALLASQNMAGIESAFGALFTGASEGVRANVIAATVLAVVTIGSIMVFRRATMTVVPDTSPRTAVVSTPAVYPARPRQEAAERRRPAAASSRRPEADKERIRVIRAALWTPDHTKGAPLHPEEPADQATGPDCTSRYRSRLTGPNDSNDPNNPKKTRFRDWRSGKRDELSDQ